MFVATEKMVPRTRTSHPRVAQGPRRYNRHGIGGPSKMTFGTSNLLVFFVAEGYTIIKGVLDSTRPGLHNGLRKN